MRPVPPSAAEAVVRETPAARATSRSVTWRESRAIGRDYPARRAPRPGPQVALADSIPHPVRSRPRHRRARRDHRDTGVQMTVGWHWDEAYAWHDTGAGA